MEIRNQGMIDLGKKNILGILVDAVDYEAAVNKIIAAAKADSVLAATALAVHGLMTGVMDPVQKYRLNHLDLITADGQPVRWVLNWLYHTRLEERVYGPDLMLYICEQAQNNSLPIYLFGSNLSVIENLELKLKLKFPQLVISGSMPSKFRRLSEAEQYEVVENIKKSGAKMVFIGLGCPRQEVWVYENRNLLSMPLIAVGAAFDFHAGNIPQASASLQKWGLEWLFRILQEPKRLWKRYLLLNPLYILLSLMQKTGIKQFNPDHGEVPMEAMRYG